MAGHGSTRCSGHRHSRQPTVQGGANDRSASHLGTPPKLLEFGRRIKMRTTSTVVMLIATLLFGTMALAAPASAATFADPAVITSAGQSPGALMLRVLADRAGVENVFDATATPDALDGAGSLIVVIGASMKGLGAAGIDVEDEFSRVVGLLERAEELNIPVIAMHVEGGPRRGATSDDLTTTVFPYADYAVVRAD